MLTVVQPFRRDLECHSTTLRISSKPRVKAYYKSHSYRRKSMPIFTHPTSEWSRLNIYLWFSPQKRKICFHRKSPSWILVCFSVFFVSPDPTWRLVYWQFCGKMIEWKWSYLSQSTCLNRDKFKVLSLSCPLLWCQRLLYHHNCQCDTDCQKVALNFLTSSSNPQNMLLFLN